MPCGFSCERAWSELTTLRHTDRQWSAALASWPLTFVVDAASYFSRPGPRLVDGVELLAALLSKGSDAKLDNLTTRAVPRFSPLSTSLL
jgi:iron complex transport system substrate-binding protein